MRRTLPVLTALVLATCAQPAFAQSDQIRHYLRSDQDGSAPEAISVWLRADGSVEVFKRVSPCTNAALVTAEFDRTRGEPRRLVGGRLGRDGTQQPFAWLEHDPASRGIAVRFGAPDAPPVETATLTSPAPWRLYDFDFADWNALADGPPPARLTFALALIWPEGEPVLRDLGEAEAVRIGEEVRAGRRAFRYRVSARDFEAGDLWLDATTGRVIEVAWAAPNHPGYGAYRLVLTGTDDGEAAWRALLASHWAGCPG